MITKSDIKDKSITFCANCRERTPHSLHLGFYNRDPIVYIKCDKCETISWNKIIRERIAPFY